MKHLILILAISISSTFAQPTANHLFVPSGFVIESLSGYGYSKSVGNQSDIASLNPTAMEKYNTIAIGFSYLFENDIKPAYVADNGSKRIKKSTPQSVGLVIPYQDLRLGFGFSQKYNSSLIFPNIQTTTVDQPNGTGDFIDVIEESYVFRYSVLMSYGISDLIKNKDRFALGFSVNNNSLNYHYMFGIKGQLPQRIIRSHGEKLSFSVGASYSTANSAGIRSLFSLLFERGTEFEKMTTDENYFLGIPDMILKGDIGGGKEPDKIHLGFDHSFSDKSQISSTLSYIVWSSTSNIKNDQPEASVNYIYSPLDKLITSFGLFWTSQHYKDDYFNMNGAYNSLFMSLGLIYSYSFADFNIVIADSHLLSGKARKQTLGKVLFGFHF